VQKSRRGTWRAAGRQLAQPAGACSPFFVVGVGLLGGVLYPRRHRPGPRRGVAYFADVVRLRSVDALRAALVDPTASAFDATVDQLWQSSAIVVRKYALLRAEVGVLAAAVACLGLAVGLA
jgi:hypothetical protein